MQRSGNTALESRRNNCHHRRSDSFKGERESNEDGDFLVGYSSHGYWTPHHTLGVIFLSWHDSLGTVSGLRERFCPLSFRRGPRRGRTDHRDRWCSCSRITSYSAPNPVSCPGSPSIIRGHLQEVQDCLWSGPVLLSFLRSETLGQRLFLVTSCCSDRVE
jgi:hypothetical protein